MGTRIAAAGARIAAAGAAVATAAAGFAAFKGLKLAADFEQANVAMSTMLGSAEDAAKVLKELTDFAAATPFEFPELQGATQKLLAFGEGADTAIGTLRMIGDVSAGIGAPIGEIAEIYGKARVQGRLFMEDINQLTGRGIPIIGQLAKQFGVAESAIRDLVSSGAIHFDNLEQAFRDMTNEGGQFAGLMKAQSKTLSGLFSTMKDNIGLSMREVAQSISDALDLKGIMRDMIGVMDDLKPRIVEIGVEVGNATKAVVDWTIANGEAVVNTAKWTAGIIAATYAMPALISGTRTATKAVQALTAAYKALASVQIGTALFGTLLVGLPKTATLGMKLSRVFQVLGTSAANSMDIVAGAGILGNLARLGKRLLSVAGAAAKVAANIGMIATAVGSFATVAVKVAIFGQSWSDASLDVAKFLAKITGVEAAMRRLGLIDGTFERIHMLQDAASKSSEKLIANMRELESAATQADALAALEERVSLLKERLSIEAHLRQADIAGGQSGASGAALIRRRIEELKEVEARIAAINNQMQAPDVVSMPGATATQIDAAADAIDRFAESVFNATRTDLENFEIRIARLGEAFGAGKLDVDTYGRAVAQAVETLGAASSVDEVSARLDALNALFTGGAIAADQYAAAWDAIKASLEAPADDIEKWQRLAEQVFESTRTPLEQYEQRLTNLSDLLNRGLIDWETYGRAVRDAREQLEGGATDMRTGGEFQQISLSRVAIDGLRPSAKEKTQKVESPQIDKTNELLTRIEAKVGVAVAA